METAIMIVMGGLGLIDIAFVFYALRKMYHSMFNIVYVRFQAIVTECIVIGFIACGIVVIPPGLLLRALSISERSMTANIFMPIYLIAFFILSVIIIKKYSKKGGGEQ